MSFDFEQPRSTVERFSGFAGLYDRFRPPPPEILSDILNQYGQVDRPQRVVDLGCGTGLSTRYWAERADQVIGVDPSRDMLAQANAQTNAPNVFYLFGFGHQTGLHSHCADIVTCSQSMHWMEPDPTLAEIARLLCPWGVFAAYDHDFYPVIATWEVESAYRVFRQRAIALDGELNITARTGKWPKAEHLSHMQASGYFRFTRELNVHQVVMGNAERLVDLALSFGLVQELLKAGVREEELGLDSLKAEADRILGDELKPWIWSTHVWIGVV